MYRSIMVCCVLIAVIPASFEQRYLERLKKWIQPPTINYKDELVKFNLTKQIHVHRHQHHHHHHNSNATHLRSNHSKNVDHQEYHHRPRQHQKHHPQHYHHRYHHNNRTTHNYQENPLGNVINDYPLVTNSIEDVTTEQITIPTPITATNQTKTLISTTKLSEVESVTNKTTDSNSERQMKETKEEPKKILEPEQNKSEKEQKRQNFESAPTYEVTESAEEEESKEREIYEIAERIKQNIETVNKTGRAVKTKGKPRIKVLFDLNDILK